jgi:hypothetical protein
MTTAFKFALGQQVTHVANREMFGVITCISWRGNGIVYSVTWQDLSEKAHVEFELVAVTSDTYWTPKP